MLIAKNEKGQLVNVLFRTKEELDRLVAQKWWCGSCGRPLSLKNGPIKQSHFAHYKNTDCQNFSEGETEEHLKGKLVFAQWCDQFNLPYQLEAYLPELKQRPDLLLGSKIAIEFQCSSLSLARFVERTETYQRHGYQVIWVVGKQFFVGKRLTAFQRACMSYHQKIGFYLWELDVVKEELRCLVHMEELQGTGVANYTRKAWQTGCESLVRVLNFPQEGQLFIRRQYQELPLLLRYFEKIERDLVTRNPQTLLIQEHLYRQGVHLRGLDSCFFLPVTQPLLGKGSVFIWRLLVWQALEESATATVSQVFQQFQALFYTLQPSCYVMPLVPMETNLTTFFTDYLRALSELGYLSYRESQLIIKQRPKIFGNSQERELAVIKGLASYNHISATPCKNMLS